MDWSEKMLMANHHKKSILDCSGSVAISNLQLFLSKKSMRDKLLIRATVLLICIFVFSAQASITDVVIQPEIPTFSDDISLLIFGVEGSSMEIVGSSLTIDGTFIEKCLYFEYIHPVS